MEADLTRCGHLVVRSARRSVRRSVRRSDKILHLPCPSPPPIPIPISMRSIALVLLLFTNSLAAHVALRSGKCCFGGCETVVNFAGLGSEEACASILRATSLYLCIDAYCEETGRETWLHDANKTCAYQLPPYEIIDQYDSENRSHLLPDEELFERAFTTLVRWLIDLSRDEA